MTDGLASDDFAMRLWGGGPPREYERKDIADMTHEETDESSEAWISLRQAARIVGHAVPTVLSLVARKQLISKDFAGRVWIERASAEQFRARADEGRTR